MKKPVIGITMGDPCGIGPEVAVKAIASDFVRERVTPIVFGDKSVIEKAKTLVGTQLQFEVIDLTNVPESLLKSPTPTAEAGMASLKYIETAAAYALEGTVDAIVTAPINKQSIHLAKSPFPGHTELLMHLTGAENVVMMFDGGRFRVALVTIHVPLSKVPSLITIDGVFTTIDIVHSSLVRLCGIPNPRICVTGLNPHAGEGGAFGDEEVRCIEPAIQKALKRGIDVEGPMPADTLFYYAAQGRWDAVVAMYHDQGLIPFKMLSFDEGVNVTLGLPFVRTSPDHGTAFDIAWKGVANPTSMISAIKLATEYLENMGKKSATPST